MALLVEFNKGMPSDELMGRPLVEECLREVSSSSLSTQELLQYGEDGGSSQFRKSVCDFLNTLSPEVVSGECAPFEEQEIFSSAGNSHAVALLCTRLLKAPSSSSSPPTVLVDDPTYPWVLQILRDHQCRIVSVPMTPQKEGCPQQTDVQGMRRACEEASLAGSPVRMCYVIPSFHNPTGVSASRHTRVQLIRLAREHNFFILSDDVYQLLWFNNAAPPPHLSLLESLEFPNDPNDDDAEKNECRVISLGTASKLLSPAMRVGWIHSRNKKFIRSLADMGELISGGGFSALSGRIFERALLDNRLALHVAFVRKVLHEKAQCLCRNLRSQIGLERISFNVPDGGYFVWISLNQSLVDKGVTAKAWLDACLAAKPTSVKFFVGNTFCADRASTCHQNHIRLSFALYSEETMSRAVSVMAHCLDSICGKVE